MEGELAATYLYIFEGHCEESLIWEDQAGREDGVEEKGGEEKVSLEKVGGTMSCLIWEGNVIYQGLGGAYGCFMGNQITLASQGELDWDMHICHVIKWISMLPPSVCKVAISPLQESYKCF